MTDDYDINGTENMHKAAREALPVLVRQAKAGESISYSDLADELGVHHRNLNDPLGVIGDTLKQLNPEFDEDVPQIQSIVVRKDTKLPGSGIEPFIVTSFEKLSPAQKEIRIKAELQDVFIFPDWDEVLQKLKLQPNTFNVENIRKLNEAASAPKKFSSGESELHRNLKLAIKENPEKVGFKKKMRTATTEHGLPSGDSVDVFFESRNGWYGVEVKSTISDDKDILRGIYQCVKYRAVMEAQIKAEGLDKRVEVVLALGGKLPNQLISVKNSLGVTVIPEITVD